MKTIRAAIYARVSKPGQAREDKISIQDQLRECRKYIEREGWRCAGEYVDPGVTSRTLERPGLQALLAALDQFDVVVAWDFDRFYRERLGVAGFILDTVDEHRKQITSVKQPIPIFDPAQYDPRHNDTPYMLREMAGFTSGIDNRRRFRALQKGLVEKFKQGYMMHPAPFGYRKALKIENGNVVKLPREIVPEEARVVRRMYRDYLSGKSFREIAFRLNTEGILSRRRQHWSSTSVSCVIRNPVYCGKVYHIHTKVNGRFRRLPEDKWTIQPGKHKPIVSEKIWQDTQAMRRRKYPQARAVGSPALLSGLLRCGYCGAPMCKEGARGVGYYSCAEHRQTKKCCRNAVRLSQLEHEVTAHVFQLVRSEVAYEKVTDQQQAEQAAELKAEIAHLERLVCQFDERKSRLFDLYETSLITRDEFMQRNEVHGSQFRASEEALSDKRQQLTKAESAEIDRATFREVLKSLEQTWERCDKVEKKQKLLALIEKIVIKDRTFKIYFRVAP